MMRKIIFGLLLFASTASFGQSSLYNNAIYNLKDPRSSSVYSFGWLNNTDSIATMDSVGWRMVRPLRFKPLTTAQLPAFATAGMVVYCSDSTALLYHNGTAWVKISAATGGGSTPTFQQVLTQGSTLTTNNTVTLGTNTYTYNSNSATKLHIDANGRVSIGGTNNSGNAFYVNGTMGAADGSVLFSFAAASLQYYCPSSDMIIRLNGQGEEWRFAKSGNAFDIYPVTTNADPLRFRDNANGDILSVIPSNRTVAVYAMPAATANDTKLVVRGSSDSAFRQLDYPIVQSTYSVTLTNTTNIASSSTNTTYYERNGSVVTVWGTFTAAATTGSTVCEMGFSLPVASALVNVFDLGGSGSSDTSPVKIIADATNDRAKLRFTPPNTSSTEYSFIFSYKVL